ncbi:cation diffusion facilitator family transporter [Elusimicrobiota bacterium]
MRSVECVNCGKKAAWVTLWVNIGGTILKAVVGVLGNSTALLADAFHSAADAVISVVTIVCLKISGESADKNHPYGHGKVEFIAAGIVTFGLLAAVFFLFREAFNVLHSGTATKPKLITLFAALIAIVTSEMLFRFNLCAGKNLKSPVLIANAWHNRYDVYTSIIVAVGIIGAKLGFHYLDPIAAILVGITIIRVVIEIFKESYDGLMDTSLPKEERERIINVIKEANGIVDIKYLKTRRTGQQIWIDLGIKVDPKYSVAQAHETREKIRNNLFLKLENVAQAQVELLSE